MASCLLISMCRLLHQTFPSLGGSPVFISILARLQSTQCLGRVPAEATKQGICRIFPICRLRWPHHTVPGEAFIPPAFLSWPCLHVPHWFVMMIPSNQILSDK